LDPECRPLANSSQLCRLEMCEAQCRKILVLFGERRQPRNEDSKRTNEKIKSVSQEDEIGIVSNVAGCCAETDNMKVKSIDRNPR